MPGAPLRRPGAAQAASAEAPEAVPAGAHEQVSRTLHIQAAKVVAANAATIGDALLAVPLLCSAGAAPQRAFDTMSESLSTQSSRVTKADSILCSTCKGGPARPPLVWGTAACARPCAAARSALPRGAALQEVAAWRALRGCLARRGPPCAADAVPDDMPCLG